MLLGLLFLIAFLPRVYGLGNHSLFVDELTWSNWGKQFVTAIRQADFEYLQNAWWFNQTQTSPIGIPATFLIGLSDLLLATGQSDFSLDLTNEIVAIRLPIALLGSLAAVALFLFVGKLFGAKLAYLAFFLFALDPVVLGVSRYAHQDMALTFFFIVSIFSFVLGEEKNLLRWKLLSALFFALAFLTKPVALVIPLVLTVWKLYLHRGLIKDSLFGKIFTRDDFFWLLASAGFIIALWPALWSNPPLQLLRYLSLQSQYASQGHANFFMGVNNLDPGPLYYPVLLLIRLPEVVLLGLATAFLFAWRRLKRSLDQRLVLLLLWFLAVVTLMTLSPKKLEIRYILPLYPPLLIASAWGLWQIFSLFLKKKLAYVAGGIIAFLAVYYLGLLLFLQPNYYLYYNQLIGGPRGATNATLLDPGSGLKPAAEEIKVRYGPDARVFVFGYEPIAAYYGLRTTNSLDQADILLVEQHVLVRSPADEVTAYAQSHQPDFIVELAGAEVAWVYKLRPGL